MTLSNLSKLIIVGGVVGASIGIGIETSRPLTTAEKILYWERNNGGCKVYLAINYNAGTWYRPGETKTGLTEEQLKIALKDITKNPETKDQNKADCEANKNKKLVLAYKSSKWIKDTQNWDEKIK